MPTSSKGGLSPPFPTGDWVVVTIVIADFLLGFGTGAPFLNGSQAETKNFPVKNGQSTNQTVRTFVTYNCTFQLLVLVISMAFSPNLIIFSYNKLLG